MARHHRLVSDIALGQRPAERHLLPGDKKPTKKNKRHHNQRALPKFKASIKPIMPILPITHITPILPYLPRHHRSNSRHHQSRQPRYRRQQAVRLVSNHDAYGQCRGNAQQWEELDTAIRLHRERETLRMEN